MEDVGGPGQGGGGVKAMLNKIKEQFRDSHVQLPDGTVPKGKINITKKPTKDSVSIAQPVTESEGPSKAETQGVKAKLAELNSKFSNSFVKLPDGSVPSSSSTPKKQSSKLDSKPEPDIAVQDIPSSPSKKSAGATTFSDYPQKKKSNAGNETQELVYSDYETIHTFEEKQNSERRKSSIDMHNSSSRSAPNKIQAAGVSIPIHAHAATLGSTSSASAAMNPPPALLKGSRSSAQQQPDDPPRFLTTPRQVESKSVEKPELAAANVLQAAPAAASRTPTYGIGVSFKPDDKGYLQVILSSLSLSSKMLRFVMIVSGREIDTWWSRSQKWACVCW